MSDINVVDADTQREINRSVLQDVWQALISGDSTQAANKYANDAVIDFPQTGEFVAGRSEIARRGLIQAGETIVTVNRLVGDGQVWVSECEVCMRSERILLLSVAELSNGLILRETRYRASAVAPRRGRAD